MSAFGSAARTTAPTGQGRGSFGGSARPSNGQSAFGGSGSSFGSALRGNQPPGNGSAFGAERSANAFGGSSFGNTGFGSQPAGSAGQASAFGSAARKGGFGGNAQTSAGFGSGQPTFGNPATGFKGSKTQPGFAAPAGCSAIGAASSMANTGGAPGARFGSAFTSQNSATDLSSIVQKDMAEALTGNCWPFSVYSAAGDSAHLAPEVQSDISPEEWRWQQYQSQAAGAQAVQAMEEQWQQGVQQRLQVRQTLATSGTHTGSDSASFTNPGFGGACAQPASAFGGGSAFGNQAVVPTSAVKSGFAAAFGKARGGGASAFRASSGGFGGAAGVQPGFGSRTSFGQGGATAFGAGGGTSLGQSSLGTGGGGGAAVKPGGGLRAPVPAGRSSAQGTETLAPLPVVASSDVTEEQLAQWNVKREQFDAFNATAFRFGSIPEVEPPAIVA